MTEFFLALLGTVVGLPVLLVCAGLALRRQTRHFAIPPLLGLFGGAIASMLSGPFSPLAFVIAFALVSVPLAFAMGFVSAVGAIDTRWPNAVRGGFASVIALAVIVLSVSELDRPAAQPTAQFSGTVGNASVRARPDGMVEQRMEVTLEDGRKVMASAFRPMQVAPGAFERVRVSEYHSVITGRPSYRVETNGAEPSGSR